MPHRINISRVQAESLMDALTEHVDGNGVFITQQGDTSLVVSFDQKTIVISPGGQRESV